MKQTIYIVRHGETDWNKLDKFQGIEDIPLNKNGLDQAIKLGEYFVNKDISTIISSPLKRAKVTADIIAKKAGIKTVETYPSLAERDYGAVSGLTKKEANDKFPDGIIPDQESIVDLKSRVIKVTNKAINSSSNHKILLVSHGAVIRQIILHYYNGSKEAIKDKLFNGSITKFIVENSKWELDLFNYIP